MTIDHQDHEYTPREDVRENDEETQALTDTVEKTIDELLN